MATPLSNPSVVDYINSTGGDASYAAREKLAAQMGITGYVGSAAQNTQMLANLRAGTTNTTTPAITSPAIAPQTPTPAVAPKTVAPYPVTKIATTPLVATSQEKAASNLSSQLQSLYDQTVGQSAYRTQQEGVYGIQGLQQTQNDLTSQLNTIKNEAAAIPLQLMQGASDRGVTTPVFGRQENSRLRTNAIAALGVNSLLEASRGNLATAQANVDRAVAQKYDPIKEAIAAKTQNLQLILNDPKTSLQDKNRAQAQLDQQNNQLAQIRQEEEGMKEVYNIATTAASNGQNFVASPQFPSLALALKAITEAPTKEAALQIASQVGLYQDQPATGVASNPDTILSPTQAKTLGVPYGTTVGQATAMGITPTSPAPATTKTATEQKMQEGIMQTFKTGISPGGDKVGNPVDADGWVDPAVYLASYNNWLGTRDSFLSKFPVDSYIKPDQYSLLPAAIRPKTKADTPTADENIF